MQKELPTRTLLRIGYLILGGWLVLMGPAGFFGWNHPAIVWALHLSVMIVGIVFLLSLPAVSKNELPGMVILSVFLLAVGVIPFESVLYFHSDNLIGIILWGLSLLAGCLIPLNLSEKRWGERFALAFLSVWLIIRPISAFSDERHIALIVGTLLPGFTGIILLVTSLVILLRPSKPGSP
jgi:hypothetical protein